MQTDIEALPALEGDARALNQVFLNLLKNAADAFEGRPGRISVKAALEGSFVLVEIQDDGPGIAPELREEVFDPFFSTKGAGKGSGLGLSIARRIVTEHGGQLELVAPEQGGACFRIQLPVPAARLLDSALSRSLEPGGAEGAA